MMSSLKQSASSIDSQYREGPTDYLTDSLAMTEQMWEGVNSTHRRTEAELN